MIEFSAHQKFSIDVPRIQTLLQEIQSDEMGGWFDLPAQLDQIEIARINEVAGHIQSNSKFLVCIGIGGSYLGHHALIEAIRPESPTKVLFAGNSLSSRALAELFETLGDADFSVNVISKSGTTTEPAVTFRFLREKLFAKYGESAKDRIYATTDRAKGALYEESVQESYKRFVVPDNLGGRYSVLSSVGLLPLAVAGVDIAELLEGAKSERAEIIDSDEDLLADAAPVQYAVARQELAKKGHDVEVLAAFEPSLRIFEEWWKQLFGESEGKNQQGIFPASAIYTTDLHSMGQYLQDGRRNIFETVLQFTQPPVVEDLKLDVASAEKNAGLSDYYVPELESSLDGLEYLAGQELSYLNQKALEATIDAHRAGGIPVFEITAPDFSARSFGALIYFFELACALSAKLAGVNPFDQPGVEAYKENMFKLLGKPGYE